LTTDYHNLVPLNGLSREALQQAMGQAREIRVEPGHTLFRQGDSDDQAITCCKAKSPWMRGMAPIHWSSAPTAMRRGIPWRA
jgi:hypothetical protein